MCISKEEYFARLGAQKESTLALLGEPILLHDPGDETAHDPFVDVEAGPDHEEIQDQRIATLEGQIQALTERLVHLAVAHATFRAEVSLSWRARLKARLARTRDYRPKLFMAR